MAKKLTPKDYSRWDGRVGIEITNNVPDSAKKTTGKTKSKKGTKKTK